jgi:hypothetical protein
MIGSLNLRKHMVKICERKKKFLKKKLTPHTKNMDAICCKGWLRIVISKGNLEVFFINFNDNGMQNSFATIDSTTCMHSIILYNKIPLFIHISTMGFNIQ